MNNTDRDVLDMIRRYSVKFGAAHLKHDTIANAIGKSNATVRRAIRKLDKLGIIKRTHYVRPVMNGFGANIYAIKPFLETMKKPEEPASIQFQQVEREAITTDESPVSTTLFGRMKALLSSTFCEETLARRFFSVYRQLTLPMLKFSIHEHKSELFEQIGIQAMQIAFSQQNEKIFKISPAIIQASYVILKIQ